MKPTFFYLVLFLISPYLVSAQNIEMTASGEFWSTNITGLNLSSTDVTHPPTAPLSGAGSRLMWIPTRSAFRVGTVTNSDWNAGNIGLFSTAFGFNTLASNEFSVAIGLSTKASGYAATAMGYNSKASGYSSTAMGYLTKATKDYSIAAGIDSEANGMASFAMGGRVLANDDWSTAMGVGTMAIGWGSTALGDSTSASGRVATSMGNHTSASGENSTAMGYFSKAYKFASVAMGYQTESNGMGSTTMGRLSKAEGDYATGIGYSTEANGVASVAMGYLTKANGRYALAAGVNTVAEGWYSTALGNNTKAGYNATAMGYSTFADGDYSLAVGQNSAAIADNSTVIGKNITLNSNATGSIYLADAYSSRVSDTRAISNAFYARFNGGYYFYSEGSGGKGARLLPGETSWSVLSDSTLKENFIPANTEDVLNSVSHIRIGTWNYKGQDPSTFRHWGVMAQDFYKHFGQDKYGTIGNDTTITTADFDGVSFAAIKGLEQRTREQSLTIKEQEKVITELLTKIEYLEEKEKRNKEFFASEILLIKQQLGLNSPEVRESE